jgi:hypothetical protein
MVQPQVIGPGSVDCLPAAGKAALWLCTNFATSKFTSFNPGSRGVGCWHEYLRKRPLRGDLLSRLNVAVGRSLPAASPNWLPETCHLN